MTFRDSWWFMILLQKNKGTQVKLKVVKRNWKIFKQQVKNTQEMLRYWKRSSSYWKRKWSIFERSKKQLTRNVGNCSRDWKYLRGTESIYRGSKQHQFLLSALFLLKYLYFLLKYLQVFLDTLTFSLWFLVDSWQLLSTIVNYRQLLSTIDNYW